jgi:hypothetical protein
VVVVVVVGIVMDETEVVEEVREVTIRRSTTQELDRKDITVETWAAATILVQVVVEVLMRQVLQGMERTETVEMEVAELCTMVQHTVEVEVGLPILDRMEQLVGREDLRVG